MSRIQRRWPGLVAIGLAFCPLVQAAGPGFTACLDYHCDHKQSIRLTTPQWQLIREMFTGTNDATQERARIRQAIAYFEELTGRQTDTWRDLAENRAGAGLPGQLDCIAESRNTDTYLHLLQDDGLLHWHEVLPRRRRAPLLFDVHWSAVIRDKQSQQDYAVDSWWRDNGQPPYIQPLSAWQRGEDLH